MRDFWIGEVTAVVGGVPTVRAGGVEIPRRRLWVGASLLDGFDPRLRGSLSGSGAGGAVDVSVTPGQLVADGSPFAVGDRVVILTCNGQDFYLLERMIRCG